MSTTYDQSTLGTPQGYSTISSTRSGYSIDGGTAKRQPRFNNSKSSTTPDKMAFEERENYRMHKYNFAVVSRISPSFVDKSSFAYRAQSEVIDIDKARDEHEVLVDALRKIGLDVIELPSDEKHPDGVFVDDIAVVINNTALICNPPPPKNESEASRQGELAVVRSVLRKELGLKVVEVDYEKAYVEGGDVLFTGREIFVGISERTNWEGAEAVARAFPEYETAPVPVHGGVHLKSLITMCTHDCMTVLDTPEGKATFDEIRRIGCQGYKYITVKEKEAANVIFCNNHLLHLSRDQIPHSSAIFENKIDATRIAIPLAEPLKRQGTLGSCVLLISRTRNFKSIQSSKP